MVKFFKFCLKIKHVPMSKHIFWMGRKPFVGGGGGGGEGGGIKFPRIAGARQATAGRCPLLAANCWSHNLKETDPDKIILFSSQHMMKRRFM